MAPMSPTENRKLAVKRAIVVIGVVVFAAVAWSGFKVWSAWNDVDRAGDVDSAREALEAGRRMGYDGNGVLFHGTKGTLMCGCYGESPRLIPETAMKAYKRPAKTIERIPDSHEQDWIRACKGQGTACSNFDYSGPLTEMVLAGTLAMRFPGKRLMWDGDNMKVTNHDAANEFVHREYRKGWSL